MSTDHRPDHRLEELLTLEATYGLTPAEANELDVLLAAFPNEDPDAFELAAAAVHLALSGPPEPLPAHLAEKLELAAAAFTPPTRPATPKRARPAYAAWAGWAVAACLAGLLVFSYWPKKGPTIAENRAKLQKEVLSQPLTFVDGKAGCSANVVWSNQKQEGYLEAHGLPALDPSKEQYQLWIVDGGRTDPKPVDGGVFDVQPDGTVLIPVRAALKVKDAKAFAITKETAGGVVESKGPMLLVLTPKPG